jgi:hypothetical protein
LKVKHIELKDANAFVEQYHRHHKPVVGHRFSIACVIDDDIHGVAIVGRPVARMVDPSTTLEVTRLVTDGTANACSFLYGAAARAGKELGYSKIQTYILESETGITLKASGWKIAAVTHGGEWKHTDGKPRRTDQPTEKKVRWEKVLNP